jgi:hypothetical protein
MMIKKITVLTLTSLLFISAASAEETVKDTLGIVGKWKVWAESASKDKEKKLIDNLWEFKADGVLHAVSTDPRTKTLDLTTKYYIEDGAIMKEKAGRPGKFERCTVEKKDNDMVLGCPGLFFFMKKAN